MKSHNYITCFLMATIGCFLALFSSFHQINGFTILTSLIVGLALIAFIYLVATLHRKED